MTSRSVTKISTYTVYPEKKSTVSDVCLSELHLSSHCIEKGVLFTRPPFPFDELVPFLLHSLSSTLPHFPAFAGRFFTNTAGQIFITCNDAGVYFVVASAKNVKLSDVFSPDLALEFFVSERPVSYKDHHSSLTAVQVTELDDGVFVGFTFNRSVADETSLWNFFNTFADICSRAYKIHQLPNISRFSFFDSPDVPLLLGSVPVLQLSRPLASLGGSRNTFNIDPSLRERSSRFSPEVLTILAYRRRENENNGLSEILLFEPLSAQQWRSGFVVDLARHANRLHRHVVAHNDATTRRQWRAVSMGDLFRKDIPWSARRSYRNVVVHNGATTRRRNTAWDNDPRPPVLGNPDRASITIGSTSNFPMYDVGLDGKISALTGREWNGSVDLEVGLAPETMAVIENDDEFKQDVSPDILETVIEIQNRYDAAMEIERRVLEIRQVVLDARAMTEAQGEQLDEIEDNVLNRSCCVMCVGTILLLLITLIVSKISY